MTTQAHAGTEPIGTVTHYFSHLHVAAVALDDTIQLGEQIHIKGHTTDVVQAVDSMEIDNLQVEEAGRGDDVAIHVDARVREHDRIYRE